MCEVQESGPETICQMSCSFERAKSDTLNFHLLHKKVIMDLTIDFNGKIPFVETITQDWL